MGTPLDHTLRSNAFTAYVPRIEQSIGHSIKYWAQQVAHSLRSSVIHRARAGESLSPSSAKPNVQPVSLLPTDATAQNHLPHLRCAETGQKLEQLPIGAKEELLARFQATAYVSLPAEVQGWGQIDSASEEWFDAFHSMATIPAADGAHSKELAVLPDSLTRSSLLNAALDDQIANVSSRYSDAELTRLIDLNPAFTPAGSYWRHLQGIKNHTAEPSLGRVVKGFPNTLVDTKTGFVAGVSIRAPREIVISFAPLGAQHHPVKQFFRCAFEAIGLWVPKNYAQASKLTREVKEHLAKLNEQLPQDKQYSLSLNGHSMGGSLATYAALRHNVPAKVTNPLHLGFATRAKLGAQAIQDAPKLVTEVVVQTDPIADNRFARVLEVTDLVSVPLTGEIARNRGALGHRYLIPRPTEEQLFLYHRSKLPSYTSTKNISDHARQFNPHIDLQIALEILENPPDSEKIEALKRQETERRNADDEEAFEKTLQRAINQSLK